MVPSSSSLRLLLAGLLLTAPLAAVTAQPRDGTEEVDDDLETPEPDRVEDEFDHIPRAAQQRRQKDLSPDKPVVSPPTPAAAPLPATIPARAAKPDPKAANAKPAPAAPAAQAAKNAPAAIALARAGPAELRAAFDRFRQATEAMDAKGAAAAQQELLELKADLGILGMDALSVAFARAAQKRQDAKDDLAAVKLAQVAVDLSPGLPWAQLALARANFRSDAAEVGRWAGPLWATLAAGATDPRYLRPGLADLGAALVAALIATAVLVIGVLAVRRLRYFLHDVHHLFPRAAARWQTAPLALLLLSLPLVFRLGLVPIVAALFVSAVLYLDLRERIVGAALLALLGAAPLLAHAVTDATTFSGTAAEEVYRLERGGLEAEAAAAEVRARVQQGGASFSEVYALARHDLAGGRLGGASDLLKKAALLRQNDARLSVLLGNARFGAGDMDGALAHFRRAGELDPTLAAAAWNLSRVHYRNAAFAHDAARAVELERAQTALSQAQLADPELLGRAPPPDDEVRLNRLLISPALPWSELAPLAVVPGAGKRVADQLSWRLLGATSGPLAWLLPGVLALAALGFAALRMPLGASRACDKCGRAVCRRCDPELGLVSSLCGQCVNVFARKGLVAPQVKLRKQIEVDRFQTRRDRIAWLMGIVCSGGGHLVSGVPVRGVLFLFAFVFAVSLAVLRDGVLPAPYGELPVWLRLVPAILALAAVYLFSLRSLRRVQAE